MEHPKRVLPPAIQDRLLRFLDVSYSQLIEQNRHEDRIQHRAMVAAYMRWEAQATLTQIADYLNRHHSTIINVLDCHRTYMNERAYKRRYHNLLRYMGADPLPILLKTMVEVSPFWRFRQEYQDVVEVYGHE